MNYQVINRIQKVTHVFSFFEEVYLFGSALTNSEPNDIDILLVYSKYSEQIEIEKKHISKCIENIIQNIPVDLTILSRKELTETKFLIKTPYFLKIH